MQLSIQINRSIGVFDVLIHDEGRKIEIVITYSDFIEAKEKNPSYVFPDLKDSKRNRIRYPGKIHEKEPP